MKKIAYSLLVLLGLTSCKDFLYPQPEDFTAPSTWYQNQDQLDQSLRACYNYLRDSYSENLSVFFPCPNDLWFQRQAPAANTVYFLTHNSSTSALYSVWTQLYKGIDNSNMFLEFAGNASGKVSEENIRHMKGEALFLRAYYHFMLVCYWGNVPYRLAYTATPEEAYLPLTRRKDAFDLVIKDFEDALGMLPPITKHNNGGRASQSAAKGMLARANLYAGSFLGDEKYFAEACKWAKSLIDDNLHALESSYQRIFERLINDQYDTKESILEIDAWCSTNTNTREAGPWACYFTPQSAGDLVPFKDNPNQYIARGRNTIVTTPYLVKLYENGDTRRDWTISTNLSRAEVIDGTTYAAQIPYNEKFRFRYPGKFRRFYEKPPLIYVWGNGTNFPLLRYSDILLMFAEADNEVNGGPSADAIEAVNMVRRRGYGRPVNTPDASIDKHITGHDDFLELIREERARELAFEGHRKLDLIRWKIYRERLESVGTYILGITDDEERAQGGSGLDQNMTNLSAVFFNVSQTGRHDLLPIPEMEISTNINIDYSEQNPGW